jgi:spore maturation protein CgeB
VSLKPRIAFFGSSLVSAYWNGAATYYRGLLRALAGRGYDVTFYEPDAFERQQHRDMEDPEWARVVVYEPTLDAVRRCLDEARKADVVVKASGVGVFDEELEAGVLDVVRRSALAVFWDVDAPATLDRLRRDPHDPFRALVPRYDLILTYGGGPPVRKTYLYFGARRCLPIYNALDPDTHHPVSPDPRFDCDLAFLGNRLPDREERVEDFFFGAARSLPHRTFLIGGSGWDDASLPGNVGALGHVGTADHNAFNVTPKAVLNVSRESMARYGFSPATRVFEAAGAGACLVTDHWEGIDEFLEPQREVLVARDGEQVAAVLAELSEEEARRVGDRARRRVLAEHTYRHRAEEFESLLDAR